MNAHDVFIDWLDSMTNRINAALECDEISSEDHGLLSASLKAIRFSVDTGNSAVAVMLTNAFWGNVHKINRMVLTKSLMLGPEANKKNAKARQEFLIQEYESYIALGLDDKTARDKANVELQDNKELDFQKGYGRTQLNKIIENHLAGK
jgi:hypothetical protein